MYCFKWWKEEEGAFLCLRSGLSGASEHLAGGGGTEISKGRDCDCAKLNLGVLLLSMSCPDPWEIHP